MTQTAKTKNDSESAQVDDSDGVEIECQGHLMLMLLLTHRACSLHEISLIGCITWAQSLGLLMPHEQDWYEVWDDRIRTLITGTT